MSFHRKLPGIIPGISRICDYLRLPGTSEVKQEKKKASSSVSIQPHQQCIKPHAGVLSFICSGSFLIKIPTFIDECLSHLGRLLKRPTILDLVSRL